MMASVRLLKVFNICSCIINDIHRHVVGFKLKCFNEYSVGVGSIGVGRNSEFC